MAEPYEQYVLCDLCGADEGEQIARRGGACYVRCRVCGFIYANPRISDPVADNERSFAAGRQQYVEAHYSRRKQRAYRRVLRRFRRFRKTGRLLEIGSNVGGFVYRARQMGWQPVGVEPVDCCARYAREQHGLEVISSTLEEAGLEDNAFDVVFSNAVFEHLVSPRRVLAEAVRVLRPGGVIYTKTVNYDSYTRERMGDEWRLMNPLGHVCLFTAETLKRYYAQAGLKILKVRSTGFRQPGRGNLVARCIRKPSLSVLARFTMKGDRIVVLGQKPSLAAAAGGGTQSGASVVQAT